MYDKMSAVEISRIIRKREAKPSEICADFLAQIDNLNSQINAFITIDKDAVLSRARELDELQSSGGALTAMFGLPVAIKDNICTRDLPTTCASQMLENFCPPYDATVVSRLRENGAIILGKTNMDEFGISANGTLSEGNANAVTSGMVPLAIGNDYCGVVGYKPTYGAISRYGVISCSGSFDTVGTTTRTVADAALLASAISGHDPYDATSNPKYTPDFSNIIEAKDFSLKGKKIGILKEFLADDRHAVVSKAAEIYESLGADIVEVSIPAIEYAMAAYYTIAFAETSSNLSKFDGMQFGKRSQNFSDIDSLYINSRTEFLGEEVKQRIILGTYTLMAGNYDDYYKKARAAQQLLREQFKAAYAECDIMLTPMSFSSDIFAVPANVVRLPTVSVPFSKDADESPMSVQLIGKHFDDVQLMAFAQALESAISGGESI